MKTTQKAIANCTKNSFTVAYDGLKAVTHHAKAKKHKECESAAAMSHRMKSFFTPKGSAQREKVGIAELTEVYHSIKHHISYVAQDCSLKVLKQVISDSDIVKQMTGGRTKCTALVNQVLFPYSMELVQEDLKNHDPFSVATDASNKGNRKFFQVAIQYFSPKSGICHKILDFYENSTSIKERLCEVMDKSRLPWSRVTAYGADNASVNFGVNNYVFKKLKSEENNDIIAAHCNDHILHNCAKNALKVMPVDVENIVMKVFAEFSCSAKKREDLKSFVTFLQGGLVYLKLLIGCFHHGGH
ncbi:disintegrin and metalloproteinase domain-containing protein 29 [Trichonephila clavipes]|nr:disintegrin and metalloproteinase domain-containing protein 29 [Trichonephila clavipes]